MTLPTRTLPANNQASSPLLRLPAELRLKILRLLLKKDKPILSAGELQHRECVLTDALNYESETVLSSQGLRCCQTLRNEAAHVLYQENVLTIWCKSERSNPRMSFNVLDASYRMSDILLSLKTREVPKDFMAIVDQEFHHATDADVQVVTSYIRPVVEKFAQIQLNFDFDVNEQDSLYQATALLRKPLQGKIITVVTDSKDVCLSPCLGFRCKSFNFQHSENARNLDEVTAVIESDTVVEDTVGAYIDLWSYADKVLELPTVRGRQFVDVYEDELGKFHTSALWWDLQGFQKCKAVCWAAVKAWMEAWSVAELARIDDEKKRVLEQFSEWYD